MYPNHDDTVAESLMKVAFLAEDTPPWKLCSQETREVQVWAFQGKWGQAIVTPPLVGRTLLGFFSLVKGCQKWGTLLNGILQVDDLAKVCSQSAPCAGRVMDSNPCQASSEAEQFVWNSDPIKKKKEQPHLLTHVFTNKKGDQHPLPRPPATAPSLASSSFSYLPCLSFVSSSSSFFPASVCPSASFMSPTPIRPFILSLPPSSPSPVNLH